MALLTSGTKRKKSSLAWSCLIPCLILLSAAFFIGSAFIVTECKQKILGWQLIESLKMTKPTICEDECRPEGSETLPRGIVAKTSDLEMHPLWGPPNKKKSKSPLSLLAMAVGIKQKQNVNEIVKKFPESDFVIMLFHYDGIVDEWKDLEWSSTAIHISAINQTKWWFAKRFLHPDIVAEYAYIFLWDEDLGVENFNAGRYLLIVKEEGLQISQPAIDADVSEIHHQLTAREKGSRVHRRAINIKGPGRRCYEDSTEPPCTGWVEMMAPVFSRASWRCAWYIIQNDFVHAWGVDFQLGYCAQGNRTTNVGVVDSEYLIHYGLPTLGGAENEKSSLAQEKTLKQESLSNEGQTGLPESHPSDARNAVRKQSLVELERFKNRWKKAVREDQCWVDPFQQPVKQKR
ncbi:PREDICTED: uncharacterized protein LOC109207764 [Nicotiana attenuata]|uniref:Uncharacterized protein n=1 Tax=Nicotiana attenuata TaxID=49451 RepID=A0A314KRZ7_NICAT|nr:PREDICTED: uncharacterized protein LOC109207764 [Nicotiana attenuata]OIT32128.1 hypothetical protein A4A49_15482 [Nicotiana attenuata]